MVCRSTDDAVATLEGLACVAAARQKQERAAVLLGSRNQSARGGMALSGQERVEVDPGSTPPLVHLVGMPSPECTRVAHD
jgi:hypothetical protein